MQIENAVYYTRTPLVNQAHGFPDRRGPHRPADPANARHVKSVVKAVNLLKVLAAHGELGVTELATATGTSKTSAYNLLSTLELTGMVRRTQDGRAYRLGWGLLELGQSLLDGQDIVEAARPHMDRLADVTGETVLLGVREEDRVVYLEHAQSSRSSVRVVAARGSRLPLHTTASGKVLMALASDDEVDDVLRGPQPRHTEHTLTEEEAIRREIDAVRRRGFATCFEEHELGEASVSVPVQDRSGTAKASLTVAGPVARFDREAVEELVEAVRRAAADIAADLGLREATVFPVAT